MENSASIMPLWAAIPFSIYVAVVILGFLVMLNMSDSEKRRRSNMSTQDRQKAVAEEFMMFCTIMVWPIYALATLRYLPKGIKMATTGIVNLIKDIAAGLKQIRGERNAKN